MKFIRFLVQLTALFIGTTQLFADTSNDMCRGPTALLNIMNRPTYANSACIVPPKQLLIESGYQNQGLIASGNAQNLPNLQLRLGLFSKNEIVLFIPNYIRQSIKPTTGFTATSVGFKHQSINNQTWVIATDGFIIPPSGSTAFGSAGTGAVVDIIINYSINKQFGLVGMFGVSTQTAATINGGQRFQSVNPDLALFYLFNEQTALYVEIYGQSQTAPDQSSGFNTDFGIVYLITPMLAIDLEMGQRLGGNLGGFERYAGAGLSIMLN